MDKLTNGQPLDKLTNGQPLEEAMLNIDEEGSLFEEITFDSLIMKVPPRCHHCVIDEGDESEE
jgi:hypothetical protein